VHADFNLINCHFVSSYRLLLSAGRLAYNQFTIDLGLIQPNPASAPVYNPCLLATCLGGNSFAHWPITFRLWGVVLRRLRLDVASLRIYGVSWWDC